MEDIISHIVEEWFLTEPLLFSTWCTHTLAENRKMVVPMRTGRMRIEYNPEILQDWSQGQIEARLRFEVIRILLGHPYQRQPYGAKKSVLGIASDVTLTDSYHKIPTIRLPQGLTYDRGLCFEEYYAIVEDFLDQNLQSSPYDLEGMIEDEGGGESDDVDSSVPTSMDNLSERIDNQISNEDDQEDPLQSLASQASETAEFWEEDQLAAEQVIETIRRAQRSRQWGSLSGTLKDEIEATTIVHIDYRTILSGFRASVLCSKRRLTRMIPSRRYGFQYMGSKLDFATRLLVAIDVSGSVDNSQVSQALAIINRFFKYGVENVDVIQFDVEIHGDVLSMKRARNSLYIEGRGGTSFQEPIDFFLNKRYDGLIMITDGYAPRPNIPDHFYGNILWLLYDDNAYRSKDPYDLDSFRAWIKNFPKSKITILPPV